MSRLDVLDVVAAALAGPLLPEADCAARRRRVKAQRMPRVRKRQ
jgi:hypothetical protein